MACHFHQQSFCTVVMALRIMLGLATVVIVRPMFEKQISIKEKAQYDHVFIGYV